jgi:hypothetical protein
LQVVALVLCGNDIGCRPASRLLADIVALLWKVRAWYPGVTFHVVDITPAYSTRWQ